MRGERERERELRGWRGQELITYRPIVIGDNRRRRMRMCLCAASLFMYQVQLTSALHSVYIPEPADALRLYIDWMFALYTSYG